MRDINGVKINDKSYLIDEENFIYKVFKVGDKLYFKEVYILMSPLRLDNRIIESMGLEIISKEDIKEKFNMEIEKGLSGTGIPSRPHKKLL